LLSLFCFFISLFLKPSDFAQRVDFYVQFPTAKARTAGKERRLKFYEMPQSAIAESLRQILSGVAKRYLTRCSFAVPLLRKNRPWR